MNRSISIFWENVQIPFTVFIVLAATTLAWINLGADAALARFILAEQGGAAWQWAWWMRQYATQPGVLLSLISLLFLLTPYQTRLPLFRQLAMVWILTLLLGAGLLNQVIMQEIVPRARPRDILFAVDGMAKLAGHSFPSGHAAMGFVFVAPFFVLTQFPKLRWALLTLGLGWGVTIGLARMLVGAHFLTDVLWSGLSVTASAWAFARLYPYGKRVSRRALGGIILLASLCMVLFNSFTLTLTWEGPINTHIQLNCPQQELPTNFEAENMRVVYTLSGFGAPLSNLILIQTDTENGETLRLQRWKGLYHSLKCKKLEVFGLQTLDNLPRIP